MPDRRDDFRNPGFRKAQGQHMRSGSVRPNNASTRFNPDECFPREYPKYLTPEGYTRVELVQGEAEKIAGCFRRDKLNRHQLRAFYNHAKRQLQRLDYGASFAEVRIDIARLSFFAADRSNRPSNPIPVSFKSFIDRNVNAATDEVTFRKGFMPHFEAVVAYCANLRER